MGFFTHGFEGQIQRFGIGRDRKVWYAVLFLPDAVAATLPFAEHSRLRVRGEIADVPVAGAWMPTGDGRRCFMVSPAVRKGAEVDVGSIVEMRFLVDEQERVEMHDGLKRALEADEPFARAWAALTPGRRRGLSHLISAAKTDATREKRLREVRAQVIGR
jgi:hypothetical protein